jgi:hypothetical protein
MNLRLLVCRFRHHKLWFTAHSVHCYNCGRRVR